MAAAAAARKGLTSGARTAADAAARMAPRQLLPNSAKSTFFVPAHRPFSATTDKLDKGSCVKDFEIETAMFKHKMDVNNLLHEQDMKIIKLQGDIDICRAEKKTLEYTFKLQILKSQKTMLYGAMGIVAVGLLFDLAGFI